MNIMRALSKIRTTWRRGGPRKLLQSALGPTAWKQRRSSRFLKETLGANLRESSLVVVDIGASGGLSKRWQGLGTLLKAVAFEPDQNAYQELLRKMKQDVEAGSAVLINAALSDSAGEREIFLTRKQECSSLLPPNRPFLEQFPAAARRFEAMSTVKVQTDSLDAVLRSANVANVDFIKLDTQGAELSILKGGSETVRNQVLAIEIEVEFAELYDGQPLFTDVHEFLYSIGFTLLEIQPVYWKRDDNVGGKGELIFADALYVRSLDSIFAEMKVDSSKLMKAVAIAVVYEHYDYALALLREGYKHQVVSHAESERVAAGISRL